MYTQFDKAIVAFVMAVIGIVGVVWKPLGISPEVVAGIVAAITPILIYIFPNKIPKDPGT